MMIRLIKGVKKLCKPAWPYVKKSPCRLQMCVSSQGIWPWLFQMLCFFFRWNSALTLPSSALSAEVGHLRTQHNDSCHENSEAVSEWNEDTALILLRNAHPFTLLIFSHDSGGVTQRMTMSLEPLCTVTSPSGCIVRTIKAPPCPSAASQSC